MSKQHLDFAALTGGFFERFRFGKAGDMLAHIFMRVDRQHPRRRLGALRLKRATSAIAASRAINQHAIAAIMRERQRLATRTYISVVRTVEGEVIARQGDL